MHPFAPRPIRPLGVREHAGWALKLYSIAFDRSVVDPADFAGGTELALAALPHPARTAERPGVGFCILHRGRGVDYLVLGWWDRENELPLRVWVRTPDEGVWRPARGAESFCVWDLQVIGFERDAYVATVLAAPPAGVQAYLERALHQDVPAASTPRVS